MMKSISTKIGFDGGRPGGLSTCAFAQGAAPIPWELKPDMGYAYGRDGKTVSYKMGTNNAGTLFKGARKVPKGTLFFIGTNGQLYMRPAPISRTTANSCSGRIERQLLQRSELSSSANGSAEWPSDDRLRRTIPYAAPLVMLSSCADDCMPRLREA